MADRQPPEDKALAMREYRKAQDDAIKRIGKLRAARLSRDAAAPPPEPALPKARAKKAGAKPAAKARKTAG